MVISSHASTIELRSTPIRFALVLFLCFELTLWSCTGIRQTSLPCPNTVQAKISATKSTVYVSYTEPSLTVEDGPLTRLAKTSIYYDLGHGRSLAKEVPATHPSGGGDISETITIPIKAGQEQSVTVCVTATDSDGNESAATP
ncbi:MAG: hypothetical protein U0236_12750 [Nitrospira sp.]